MALLGIYERKRAGRGSRKIGAKSRGYWRYVIKSLIALSMILTFAPTAVLGAGVFSIEGVFRAVFPAEPVFNAELSANGQIFRSYEYSDETNLIFYVGTYQKTRQYFRSSDIPEAVKNFVSAQSAFATVTSARYTKLSDAFCAIYSTKAPVEGATLRKFAISCYHDGRFISWVIQDLVGYSKKDAGNLFRQQLPHFAITQ
jgi:hypothetical protein